jgi:hypothetical protein
MESSRIKKYEEFKVGSNVKKYMNHLAAKGTHKSWFFGKPKEFELHIYYTPLKEKIVLIKIYSDSVDLEDLDLPFDNGDNISLAKKWIEDSNLTITWDIKKF